MAVIESNFFGSWVARQVDESTPAAKPVKALRQIAGDISVTRDDGQEPFSNLTRFGDAADFVNSVLGAGELSVQAQPDVLSYLCWLYFGSETVSSTPVAPIDHYKHTFTTQSASAQAPVTLWKRIGLSEVVQQRFDNCKLGSMVFEGSTANKVVHANPSLQSLDPGTNLAADPGGLHTSAGAPAGVILASANVTNTTPVVITETNHGLKSGSTVTVSNGVQESSQSWVGNGTWPVLRIDANSFSLVGPIGAAHTYSNNTATYYKGVLGTGQPFLYTDGEATFNIDGEVFRAQSQFTVTMNENLAPVFGDSINPLVVFPGTPEVSVAVTLIADTQTHREYNRLIYGSATPAAGAKPLKTIPATGSYAVNLRKGTNISLASTAASAANPCVVTVSSTAKLTDGEPVYLTGFNNSVGQKINGGPYLVRVINATTFDFAPSTAGLYPGPGGGTAIDTTGLVASTTGTVLGPPDAAAAGFRQLKITIPSVKWTPDVAIPPNPAGGTVEVGLAGTVRLAAGQTTQITVEVCSPDPGYAAAFNTPAGAA